MFYHPEYFNMFFRYHKEKVFCAHQLHLAAVLINFLRIFSKLYRYRTPKLIKDQLSKNGIYKFFQKRIPMIRDIALHFSETNERLDVKGAGEHVVRANERGGIFFAEQEGR